MTFRIAIIGGGIAGLAAAHALERARRGGRSGGIQVTVYEQRQDEADIQRYPIHLDPNGREALKEILGAVAYEHLVEIASQGTEHGGISLYTRRFSTLLRMRQYEGQQPQFVHRWVLKEMLADEVKIARGRRVVSVDDQGQEVRITFDIGETVHADLVVEADGVGSSLRSQLYLSHRSFERSPYINIQMKLVTPPDELPMTIDPHGINAVLGSNDYSILLVPFHGEPLPDMTNPSSASSAEDSPEQTMLKALNQPHPQFLFAILTVKCFEGWQDLTPAGWQVKAVELLTAHNADSALIKAFERDAIPGTIGSPWQVVSCDPARPVPYNGGRVVLIGDAAHAMPPQAGAGASTALMDAHQLSQTILSSLSSAKPLPPMLGDSHKEMMQRSTRFVKDARRRLYLSNRSGLGVISQRVALRLLHVAWRVSRHLVFLPRGTGQRKVGHAKIDLEKQSRELHLPASDSSDTLVEQAQVKDS